MFKIKMFHLPCITCQWSKTHWGKAWPPVLDLKSAVNPGKQKETRSLAIQSNQFLSRKLIKRSDNPAPSLPSRRTPVETANGWKNRCFITRRKQTKALFWLGNLTEGLVDGQVSLDVEHGGSSDLRLLKDVASPPVQDAINTADGVLGALKTETNTG